jgi:hypothetical protein
MNPLEDHRLFSTRRQFFGKGLSSLTTGIGMAALHSLGAGVARSALLDAPHYAPRAKRVIYLFMSGGPSQFETFDPKPGLAELYDKDLPDSIRNNQRITTMTSGQSRFPVAPSIYGFKQHGQAGTWVSDLLPHTAKMVDDLCVIKTVHTEAINHDPAITYIQTGHQLPGRPSMGAWVSYGLGAVNRDLPAFVVMHSTWSAKRDAQALYNRLWGSGWLPSQHQGVSLRSAGDPVLYISNPNGVDPATRRRMLDSLERMNHLEYTRIGDPETLARISQYEMAYRMQHSVPDLMDFADEPAHVIDSYGPDARKPGTFAANCLLARRLAERDVRFIQVFHRGWDQHGDLTRDLPLQCRDIDQPAAALLRDLKQRGMLDDTLVIWGGEFGRTVYCQGALSRTNYGRDHHPRNFCMWMAGGGIKPGITHGETDDFSYNILRDPVHIHDINATVLHLLGIDHERLTHRFQGRDFRLTDVHGRIVHDIIAS